MDLAGLEMFICKKYGVAMLKSAADETCAKRFDEVKNNGDSSMHDFGKCLTCRRGAVMFDLGKHKTERVKRPGRASFVIKHREAKGEATMAICHKNCEKHGPYTTGPAGTCPKCKEESGGKTVKKNMEKRSQRSQPPMRLSGSDAGGGRTHYKHRSFPFPQAA
jgi:hypothetical protein